MTSEKSDWVKMKPDELKKIIIDLAKQGETPAKIGLILRDKHGVPKAKLLGKRISEILRESNIQFKCQSDALQAKIDRIHKHMEKNKHDCGAKKSLTKSLWSLHDMTAPQTA